MAGTGRPLRGKAFIRDRFTRSPENCSYLIPNVVSPWTLMDFYREARSGGFLVFRHEMPEQGLAGMVAVEAGFDPGRTSGPVSYELYFAGIPTHGVTLEPDDVLVPPEQWQSVVDEHSGHEGVRFTSDRKKMLCMVCYCRAKDGKSVVRRASGQDIEAMEKATKDLIDRIMEDEGE